jgi:hypothetical protein
VHLNITLRHTPQSTCLLLPQPATSYNRFLCFHRALHTNEFGFVFLNVQFNTAKETLEYREYPENKEEKGDIPLKDWKSVNEGVPFKGSKTVSFALETMDRTYQLAAENPVEKEKWVKALNNLIAQRHNPSSTNATPTPTQTPIMASSAPVVASSTGSNSPAEPHASASSTPATVASTPPTANVVAGRAANRRAGNWGSRTPPVLDTSALEQHASAAAAASAPASTPVSITAAPTAPSPAPAPVPVATANGAGESSTSSVPKATIQPTPPSSSSEQSEGAILTKLRKEFGTLSVRKMTFIKKEPLTISHSLVRLFTTQQRRWP